MAEVLTLDEMKTRYDSEWILIEDPEMDANGEIVRGKVIWHSKDRDEVYRKDLELRLKTAAYMYTGELPANRAVVTSAIPQPRMIRKIERQIAACYAAHPERVRQPEKVA